MEVLSLLGNGVWQKLADATGGVVREDSPKIAAPLSLHLPGRKKGKAVLTVER